MPLSTIVTLFAYFSQHAMHIASTVSVIFLKKITMVQKKNFEAPKSCRPILPLYTKLGSSQRISAASEPQPRVDKLCAISQRQMQVNASHKI